MAMSTTLDLAKNKTQYHGFSIIKYSGFSIIMNIKGDL